MSFASITSFLALPLSMSDGGWSGAFFSGVSLFLSLWPLWFLNFSTGSKELIVWLSGYILLILSYKFSKTEGGDLESPLGFAYSLFGSLIGGFLVLYLSVSTVCFCKR